jgi:hypothetical protein
MRIECYAQRLLNPFRGTAQVIRYASAEAVTTDGLHWDIYVSNDALLRGLPGDRPVQTSDIRYGSWSAERGLKRGPINLYDDFLDMEAMGAVVYEYLVRVHDRLPFPLRDRTERWLLDAEDRPLALLDSVGADQRITPESSCAWRAGYAARERFASPAMRALGEETGCAADYLTAYVNRLAGEAPVAQWFRRDPAGGGEGLRAGGRTDLEGRRLAPEAFPPFLLSDAGHDAAHRALIRDFLAWQAPWLLLLEGLGAETRRRLECQARAQALEVARQHRLYPEVIDPAQIRAALVEAVLLQSQASSQSTADTAMSTFYIELNPCGGEYL